MRNQVRFVLKLETFQLWWNSSPLGNRKFPGWTVRTLVMSYSCLGQTAAGAHTLVIALQAPPAKPKGLNTASSH